MDEHLTERLNSEVWGQKIRSLRREKGWSQRDLADKLGLHHTTVSEIERGRTQFTLERLNRILEALGYEAVIKLEPTRDMTRAEWGPIDSTEPDIRRRIKVARRLAEELADVLYSKYDVESVYCFGSLAEKGGAKFRERSDVDLLVEGLEASDLFEAQGTLEIEVLESSPEYEGLSFDVVRAESFDADPDELVDRNEAVFVPQD